MNIPVLGFGTFRLTEQVGYDAVTQALACGYRHIDTAQVYGNEAEVGKAVADSNISRDELFITTKVWNDNLGKDNFIPSVKDSLNKLQTDYLDLLLIHWPAPPTGVTLKEALENLADAKSLGLVKHIGVSNFNIEQLKLANDVLGSGEVFTNQIEVHPYLQNHKVREFCQQQQIQVTAYMPFAVGKVLQDELIKSIAESHQVTPAAVVIAWIKQLGMLTIPSSTKKANMQANLTGLELTLSPEDIGRIATLDCNERLANPDFSPAWD